ncbi:uncharacterized protein LOC142608909 [Castanea sativa]|uniref:uncharacterized protein LOC142608909 n=1 Tax=Castanea sativa TaxID=21020 RepID=UPI003F64B6BF
MCMNALPTLVNLQRRGVNLWEICPACGKEPESICHALVRFEVAKKVWKCWVDGPIDFLNVNMEVIDIAMQISQSGMSRDLEIFFGVAWAIWYNRNKIVHESSKKKWTAPPPGVFKINVGGATSENERNSSMGVVIRDATGTVTAACCKYLQGQYFVVEVEALAIECGLLLAREQKLPQIIVESYALTAVQSITAAETNGSLGHVYQGILNFLSSFSSWRIKLVKREYNRTTYELAQYARQNEVSQVWKGACPPMVQQVIQANCI